MDAPSLLFAKNTTVLQSTEREAPSLGLGIVHSTKVILGLPETAGVYFRLPPYDTIL